MEPVVIKLVYNVNRCPGQKNKQRKSSAFTIAADQVKVVVFSPERTAMYKRILFCIIVVPLILSVSIISGCDERGPTGAGGGGNGGGEEVEPIYNMSGYAYRDLADRTDIVSFTVTRNDTLYESAAIKINNHALAFNETGDYFGSEYGLLQYGSNRLRVRIEADNFDKSIYFTIPDSFKVDQITRHNPGGYNRYFRWSACSKASGFLVSVRGPIAVLNGVPQYSATTDSLDYSINIPTTAFRNSGSVLVPDIYYIYIIGYTNGYGPFAGAEFDIPSGNEGPGLAGISGSFHAGLLAPLDSIIVTF
jgi:hypothetical protein